MIPENNPKKAPWYFQEPTLIVGFLAVGPLVLPLVWLHPTFSLNKKIVITVVGVIITTALWQVMANSMKAISEYYGLIADI